MDIGVIVGILGVIVAIWQTQVGRTAVRIARQQAELPRPTNDSFGLTASTARINEGIFGHYTGTSQNNKPTPKGLKRISKIVHIEQFDVTRQSERILITGRSLHQENGETATSWSGALWKIADDGTLFFGIELTSRGKREFGTLTAVPTENGLEGYYYSGEPNSAFVSSYKATRT